MRLEQATKLRQEYERVKQMADELRGALREANKRLRSHGCKTLKHARSKLVQLKRRAAKTEQRLEVALERFKREYADILP